MARRSRHHGRQPLMLLSSPALPPIFIGMMSCSVTVLRHAYFDGLKEDVKDKPLTSNGLESLNDLIDNSIKWD